MSAYSVGQISNWTDAEKSIRISPETQIDYVQVGDIDGVNYVTGSEGKAKTIREYNAENILISTTTISYGDATYPTRPTKIVVV